VQSIVGGSRVRHPADGLRGADNMTVEPALGESS